MSIELVSFPVWDVICDADGCDEVFRAHTTAPRWNAQREEGWKVRPGRGKGSRSAPDLCPKHAAEATP